jgi:ATP-binding cassette subfamily B protein
MAARRRSLVYLEKLRLFHAAVTIVLTIALLAWAIILWQNGLSTAGDVVLVCTLGLSILHATRDLAVALVDVTQHIARLSEALATLLVPHRLRDKPQARSLARPGASVAFENVSFAYPDGRTVFTDFSLHIEPAQRVGLVGSSGCGKSTLFMLLQRLRCAGRACLIGGQDISQVTGELAGGYPSFRRTSRCFTARSWRISDTVDRRLPTRKCSRPWPRPIAVISSKVCRRALQQLSATGA